MQKTLLFTLAVFSGLITLAQKSFELKGTIEPSFNAKYVYLYGIDWSKLNPEINDSCLVKNGQFTFKGKLYTPGLLVSLYAKGVTAAFMQLYIQPGTIEVNLKGQGWNRDENVSLRNASIHNQYQKLKALTGEKELQLAILRYRIDSLRNRHPDSSYSDLNKIADSLNQQVVQLRKKYILTYQDDYMSLVVLSYFLWGRIELEEAKSLYTSLSAPLKNLQEGKKLLEKIKSWTLCK